MLQTISNTVFFVTKGQVTPKWIVQSGGNSNSSEIMAVLVTCKFEDDLIKESPA